MSRSHKKHNIGWVCSGPMKKWKTSVNRSLRRIPVFEDLGNNAFYKRKSEIWDSPSDGRMIFEDPKRKRK